MSSALAFISLLVPLAVVGAFSGAGVTLKLADHLGESGRNMKAYVPAILSGILLGSLFLAGRDESSYVAGIVLGVVLGGKVDRPNLIAGLLTIGITGLMLVPSQRLFPPIPWLLAVVTGLALLDELAHDRFTERGGLSGTLTSHRPSLKVATVIMALAGLVSVPTAAGFLGFDLCYETTSLIIGRELRYCGFQDDF